MQYNIAFVLLEYYLHWTHEHDALNCIYACVCTAHVCMDHVAKIYLKKRQSISITVNYLQSSVYYLALNQTYLQ